MKQNLAVWSDCLQRSETKTNPGETALGEIIACLIQRSIPLSKYTMTGRELLSMTEHHECRDVLTSVVPVCFFGNYVSNFIAAGQVVYCRFS